MFFGFCSFAGVHFLLFCFSLVSLVFRSLFLQQGVLLFIFLFCFLLWLVFVCFSFIFVAIFSYFLAVVAGRRFFCERAFSRDFFCFFFFRFFFGWSVM